MQITEHPQGELLELRLHGRIDAGWGEHLGATIQKAVRAGCHRIALNCSEVNYISSLGIGVIVAQYNMLKAVNGSLSVTQPSKFMQQILTTVGLAGILIEGVEPPEAAVRAAARREVRGATAYELYRQRVHLPLSCRLIGDPSKLTTTGFSSADCNSVAFPAGTFGLGLGAFGSGFEDCKSRFGEFLAAGGCAVVLPTNEPHAIPDYVVQEGELVSRVETLYAITGQGDFSTMVRFDALSDGPGTVGLSELITDLVDFSTAPAIAFVMLAETACIVGTNLLKSPALGPLDPAIPAVRDWLSFTTERISDKCLALLVGVAGRDITVDAAAFLRPLRPGSPINAHVHGAAFNYRPVQRGEQQFGRAVAEVLAATSPRVVLHLMADARPYEGVGETDLARGACWMGPLKGFSRG